jgi:hypothetical protein
MRNSWVKNVYKRRILIGKTSASLSPTHLLNQFNQQFSVQNYPLIHQSIASFITHLFTLKLTKTPLLLPSFTHNPQDLLIEARKENLKR